MDDPVPIIPRITDPEMLRRHTTEVATPRPLAAMPATSGFFNTIYDNKVIAIIIVVTIIIIAIAAYVFYKREPEAVTSQAPAANTSAPAAPDPKQSATVQKPTAEAKVDAETLQKMRNEMISKSAAPQKSTDGGPKADTQPQQNEFDEMTAPSPAPTQ